MILFTALVLVMRDHCKPLVLSKFNLSDSWFTRVHNHHAIFSDIAQLSNDDFVVAL